METKRFRNHFSIVLERMGKILVALLFIVLAQGDELLSELLSGDFTVIPVLIALGIAVLIIGLICGWQFWIWSKTWITVDEDTFSIEKKTFNLKKNTIGIKNISNVNTEQNIFEMMIGTCKVKLDTNSFTTASSTDVLIVLKKNEAEELRKLLVRRINEINTGTAFEGTVAGLDENIEYDEISGTKEMLLNGIYSTNLFSILVLIGSIFLFVETMGEMITSGNIADNIAGVLGSIMAIAVFFISAVTNIIKTFLGMYGFRVKRDGDRLYIKYGLFKRVDFAIPVDKINAIVIHQTFIARIFKKYTAEMINVGMGDEENSSAYFTFYGSREKLKDSMEKLLPEFSQAVDAEFEREPKSVWIFKGIGLIISSLVYIGIAVTVKYFIDEISLEIIVCVTVFLIIASIFTRILNYISRGTIITENYLGLLDGCFGTSRAIIKFDKIQYINLTQNVIAKKLGIIKGSANILAMLGKNMQSIPYIREEKVNLLYKELVEWRK